MTKYWQSAFALCLWVFASNAFGDETLLRKSFEAWEAYHGLRITGKVYQEGAEGQSIDVTVCIGYAKQGAMPPTEVSMWIPNPGEPHIDDPILRMRAAAQVDGLTLLYKRELVSRTPPAPRNSTMIIASHRTSGFWTEIGERVFIGLDGVVPNLRWFDLRAIAADSDLAVLGEEEYLGQPCKRVRLTMRNTGDESVPAVALEWLVAYEPTMQVLKFCGVTGGPEGYAKAVTPVYQRRQVLSARVFNEKWLLCDKVRWKSTGPDSKSNRESLWTLEITDVEKLPRDYRGIWDYNSLTGVSFGGDAEQATRKGSPRIESTHSSEISYIPFTAEEEASIRKFIMSSERPFKRRINWARVLLVSVNVLAVGVIAYAVVRKIRQR